MMYTILVSACKQPRVLFEIHTNGFRGKKKNNKAALGGPLKLTLTSYAIYKPVCLQNRINFFGILILASSTWLLDLVVAGRI